MSISILVLTYNEEQNITACLQSVKWSDDVLVVDSFSTDRTVELARQEGARVIQNKFVNFAEQRNYGLSKGGFKNDWVLHLDADEIVTKELLGEMQQVTKENSKDAYQLSSKMIFQERWIKHASLFPWYQVRLGRKNRLSFIQVGHGQRETLTPDRIGTLNESLIHHSFSKGISDWVERHNRYSTAEARHFCAQPESTSFDWWHLFAITKPAMQRRALKRLFAHMPFRPLFRFFYMYFFRLGFLDGCAGFNYCRLLCVYECLTVLKIKEIRLQKRRDGIGG